jgi:hypothetical protein
MVPKKMATDIEFIFICICIYRERFDRIVKYSIQLSLSPPENNKKQNKIERDLSF